MPRTTLSLLILASALFTACGDGSQVEDGFYCKADFQTSAGPVGVEGPGNCEQLERTSEQWGNEKAQPEG